MLTVPLDGDRANKGQGEGTAVDKEGCISIISV